MARAVSSTDLKNRTRELLDWAQFQREPVIIESYGKPRAVLMSYQEYQQIQLDHERRRERLFRLIDEVKQRTVDTPEEEIDQIISEAIEAVRRHR